MFSRSYIVGHEGHPHYLSDSKVEFLNRVVQLSDDDGQLLTVIKAMSDSTKYKIYLLLQRVDEMPVSDIANILKLSQSLVSHALSELKLLGIVEAQKCGKLICYSLRITEKTSKFETILNSFKKK